ncbi:Dabb family protein [Dubosiella muris]|uniref:Dabb family protein n=3 Tax=Dubosiella TaxID=1937008 RepID=A0AC61R6H3_9FIRM|nr:Dabb family protein [Dubosiella muris]TGY65510.1 Dabb family protein [Dubosiella muris]
MKHIVLIKLKDRTLENQQAVAAILKKMTTKTIPYADSFFVGEDFLDSERSYDVLLEVELQRQDLERYANDPFHVTVKKEFAPYMDHSVTIDVE